MWNRRVAISVLAALAFCGLAAAERREKPPIAVPRGIPETLWRSRPGVASLTPQQVALGEDLFHDPLLSADGTISCASCHNPAIGYADHNRVAVGVGKHTGFRNAPTLFNAVFAEVLFWDGRATTLEEQALVPLQNPIEMGAQTGDDVIRRLNENARYRKRFAAVFGDENVTLRSLLAAIGAFERTLLSGNSAFDRFLAGERAGLTESAERGWHLFRGSAGCIRCHTFETGRPFFTDFQFHNAGIAERNGGFAALARIARGVRTPGDLAKIAAADDMSELGRFRITGNPADIGAFKTPTLRDVVMTAPYMHDGSIASLADVLASYSEGRHATPRPPPGRPARHLDSDTQRDLLAFLQSLTGAEAIEKAAQASAPVR